MSDLKQLLDKYASQARLATDNDKVYKDESVYNYDTPESENGLYVCLSTFVGVAKEQIPIHFSKTGSHLYLKIKTTRKLILEETSDEPEKKKPSKLGIGIDGGFDLPDKQFYFEHEYSLYIHPESVELKFNERGSDDLPPNVRRSIESIIKVESAWYKEELAAQAASWDGEKRSISRHSSSLLQLPGQVHISPNPEAWKCHECDIRKNLWLNLTDGQILCGRKQMDGSGGNNHALEHYYKTKYPLAVKLGTITAKGADVYSYDEDDMVEDTNLAVHLAHLGINMAKMEKTDKTMAELEIDLNQKVGEWDRIQEVGSKLVPLYGPGFTGMRNLGNSCYVNSVMQILFTMPDFVHKYYESYDSYVKNSAVDPSSDFGMQMSKLGYGLLSGRYSHPEPVNDEKAPKPPKGIKPTSFKSLVGKGHAEFSTKRQQDAHEFFVYLLDLVERSAFKEGGTSKNPAECFKFKIEERIECAQSGHVRYTQRDEACLSVSIAKELTLNKEAVREYEARKAALASEGKRLEPGDIVRPEIRLVDCLKLFSQTEVISDFLSSVTKQKGDALKTTRLATFPDFLVIHAKKFEFAPDWTPIKLDVSLQVPEILDINEFRGNGKKPSENELPDDEAQTMPEVTLNEAIVGQLMDMGFSLEGSRRSAFNTREANEVEAAVNWAVAHMEDPDFNSAFELPKTGKKKESKFEDEAIESITSLGFSRAQAVKALEATGGDLVRAADWVFSHMDELMEVSEETTPTTTAQTTSTSAKSNCRDGNGLYKLVGFISHMGTNANCGHYVAHILKEDKWCIFNDENVAQSENPPVDLAYLYFYRRI